MGLFDTFKKTEPSPDPSVLQRIAELGALKDLIAVVELRRFLPSPTSVYGAQTSIYGDAAASAVHAIIGTGQPEEVATFDRWYRELTWDDPPRPSWEITSTCSPESWARQYSATIAIATCHPSGYVRQQAVEAVAACRDGTELQFLLVRLNDWVPQVRFVAANAVRARLNMAYAPHWVRCLGLLERICLGGRSDHQWLRAPIDALLQRDESRGALEAGLMNGSVGVRRACVRIAAGRKDSTDLLRRALQDPDPVTSARAADVLCRTLEGDSLREALAIIRGGNARARCLALETLCGRFPLEVEPHLRAAVLDHATSVRELARFKWSKMGLPALEFARHYREHLDARTGPLLVTALRGLAETGTIHDVPVFLRYIDHARAGLREAAVLGLGRCDGQHQVDLLVKAVGDSNLRVEKAARRYAKLYLGRGAVPRRPAKSKPVKPADPLDAG